MKTDWLKARQTRYTAYVTLYIAIVLAVLAAANFLAQRYNKSFDSTSNKQFSLSDQTIKVVKGLKQDVKVQYFDKSDAFQRARDLLDRYGNLSTRLTVDFIDPDKKPTLAKAAGVRSYGTTFISVGNKREEAKSVTEEELTSALIRALKTGERTVCWASGSGEHSFDDTGRSGYSNLKETFERNNYKTRKVELLLKPEVPKDCTILLAGGPRSDYVEPVVKAIKDYLTSGGRALFLLDPPLKMQRDDISDNAALAAMLEGWGVTLNKDLVLDTSGIGGIFGLGPEVPLVTSYESQVIVREMKETASAFPIARSLEVKPGSGANAEKLFSTSANSFATANLSSAEIKLNPEKDKKGPFPLGAAVTVTGADAKNPGRFVVVGSSGWVANNILRFNGNRDLIMNMTNWLSSDEDLISIRPKEPQDRRLTLTRRQMTMIFWSSVIGLPLLVIVSGISVWWKRR